MKRKGICSVCACTEAEGCPEGCGWANVKMTLCTACAPLTTAERLQKRDESLDELAMRLSVLTDEALELKLRMSVIEPTDAARRRTRTARQQPRFPVGGRS